MEIETWIDGRRFGWQADGDFAWGNGPPLCDLAGDPLLPCLGADGFRVVDLPRGFAEGIADRAASLLGCGREALPFYHQGVDEARHLQIVHQTRELRLRDIGLAPGETAALFSGMLGLRLCDTIAALGRDHVQLRVNRPGSTDYNPPHRDASLAIWAETVNIWLPVAGVDAATSLPILPGSHCIAEADCRQTEPGGAAIAGRRYRVPAIAALRGGPLAMTRARVGFGQALVFTPCLIHGLAFNCSDHTRMALELRLGILGD